MNYTVHIQTAIDYIEEHLLEELELDHITDEAYMSLPTLYRMFSALTGHPIKEYVRKRRISIAADHLRNSSNSILDIAMDCGFGSYHSFTKTFKRIVGITPGQYRDAVMYYSFVRINLLEQVSYYEINEVSERYQDIRVRRILPMHVWSYRHYKAHLLGIEDQAFRHLYDLLVRIGVDFAQVNFFGFNMEPKLLENRGNHGYEIMVTNLNLDSYIPELHAHPFEGGLYACCKTDDAIAETIVSSWNRLLAEWLPKSSFTRGNHQYLEEFVEYKGKVTRMNLYLPVEKKIRQEMIQIVKIEPFLTAYIRSYGHNAQSETERKLMDWVDGCGVIQHKSHCNLYISYCLEHHQQEQDWWEAGISIDANVEVADPFVKVKQMEGGEYAAVTTKAYGKLTGVLDNLLKWISSSNHLLLDDNRLWFVQYNASFNTNLEDDTFVTCFIPVMNSWRGAAIIETTTFKKRWI